MPPCTSCFPSPMALHAVFPACNIAHSPTDDGPMHAKVCWDQAAQGAGINPRMCPAPTRIHVGHATGSVSPLPSMPRNIAAIRLLIMGIFPEMIHEVVRRINACKGWLQKLQAKVQKVG